MSAIPALEPPLGRRGRSWCPLGILGLLLAWAGTEVNPSTATLGGEAAVGSHDPQLLLGTNRLNSPDLLFSPVVPFSGGQKMFQG